MWLSGTGASAPQSVLPVWETGQLQLGLGTDSLVGGVRLSVPPQALGTGAIAIGLGTEASSSEAIAMGKGTRSTGIGGISLGARAASQLNDVAIGPDASAEASNGGAIAIGFAARTQLGVLGGSAVAIGTSAGIGAGGQGASADSIAIGRETVVTQTGSVAVGALARSESDLGVAIGRECMAGAGSSQGVSLGYRAKSFQQQSIAIGSDALAGGNPSSGGNALHRQCIAIGPMSAAISPQSLAIGIQATAGTHALKNQIAIGTQSRTEAENGVAVGFGATLLGSFTDGVAIGTQAIGQGDSVVAIGPHAAATADASIAIGSDVAVTMPNTARIGASGVGLLHDLKVLAATAPLVLQDQQTNTVITNQGASGPPGTRAVFLPPAAPGKVFHFIVEDADGLKITVSPGDSIRVGLSLVSTRICGTLVGESLTLVAVNNDEWIALQYIGTWIAC